MSITRVTLVVCLLAACSSERPAFDAPTGRRARASSADGGARDSSADRHPPSMPEAAPADSPPPDMACAKQTARATRQPVYLVFAFDVSGSMGKGDKPWHDRSLKWDPVVAATRSFFEAAGSAAFSASMTFFPSDGDEDERCDAASYRVPDVAMQALPSNAFGAALDVIGSEEWRGGTPTLPVVQGVLEQIDARRAVQPGRYALVLVTDGYPEGCDDDDDAIQSVASSVKARASELPTYVIGVSNPPLDDAPDVTSNLTEIAEAGGTGEAHLIDTGHPTQTAADFKRSIELIRSAAVACELPIPDPPAGRSFDKQKVSVRYRGAAAASMLAYDASCAAASSWRYDDPDRPQQIILCPATCRALQTDPQAELDVDFECEQVIGPL